MPVAMPPARLRPPRKTPDNDPKFKRVVDQVNTGASRLKRHPPAAKKASEAQAAAVPPPKEKIAGAQAKQVDAMGDAKAQKPETDSFVALLRVEIEKVMPRNLESAGEFMEGGEQERMKGAVTGKANAQKDEATGDLKSASTKVPDPSGVPGKVVTPIPGEPPAAAPAVNAGEGMPVPRPDAEVSQQHNKQDAQKQMKEAEVTDTQMKKANDPRFSAMLSEKTKVEKTADAAPAKYRAGERATLTQAVVKAQADAKIGAAALVEVKGRSGRNVRSGQNAAKERDEKRRKEVTDTIEGIYAETKQKVEGKLTSLEGEVSSLFDAGASAAIAAMKANSRREIEKFKDERYSGLRGKARWIADKFRDVPPEIKAILARNRAAFTQAMDALVVRIANLVEARLIEAKAEIDKGQTKIKAYVASRPRDLQAVGKAAEKEVSGRFDEMRQGVDNKKNELAQKLAQKYKEAGDKADAELKKIEDENRSALYSFVQKLAEVVKALLEFKNKLMAILRKGLETIKLILVDPIGFLGNLIAALKQGFNQFRAKIWAHLQKGFMEWLFGALSGAGIEIPADLSLPSILKLVLSVLGITFDRMRQKAVKLLGPTAMAVVEKLVEYIRALIQGGPAALWEQVKADLSNLKAMVIDAIQTWLIETVIKQAVTKILSLFNPAGAIVQAIMAIYNVIMFVIERASQIMAFVEAVVNSISAIASGAVAKAADWIEQSLGRLIPLVISFLARLIGLGGISAKIKEFILKAQGAVDRAIDKVLAKIVATVKKLFGGGKTEQKASTSSGEVIAQVKKDIAPLTKKRYRSARDFDTALRGVYSKNKVRGLKSLTVAGVEEDSEKPFQIIAVASPGEPVTMVKWTELFVEGAEPEGGAEKFAKAGDSTHAVLIVNGRPATKIVRSDNEGHAEDHILQSDGWRTALDEAYQGANDSVPRETTLKLVINRTPCHDRCSKNLASALRVYWRRFGNPVARKRVNFYLIATGVYETKGSLSNRSAGGPTTGADLANLAQAGWHLQGLQVKEQPTARGKILSEFILKLLNQLKKVKEP